MESTITPENPQYLVYFDHPDAPGQYSVRFFDGSKVAGIQKAAHKNLEAVRQAIPTTHEKAPYQQPAPIVEVWVLARFVDSPPKNNPYKPTGERYPRGWHPDDEKRG